MSSLLIQINPEEGLSVSPESIPNKRLLIGTGVSSLPDCVAPWHACADLLINSETEMCLGLTYKVDEHPGVAAVMAMNVTGSVVRLVNGRSPYGLAIYGKSDCDWFEIRFGVGDPNAYIIAASLDGFWFLDATRTRLLAFGVSDLPQLLGEFSLRVAPLINLPTFTPNWVS